MEMRRKDKDLVASFSHVLKEINTLPAVIARAADHRATTTSHLLSVGAGSVFASSPCLQESTKDALHFTPETAERKDLVPSSKRRASLQVEHCKAPNHSPHSTRRSLANAGEKLQGFVRDIAPHSHLQRDDHSHGSLHGSPLAIRRSFRAERTKEHGALAAQLLKFESPNRNQSEVVDRDLTHLPSRSVPSSYAGSVFGDGSMVERSNR